MRTTAAIVVFGVVVLVFDALWSYIALSRASQTGRAVGTIYMKGIVGSFAIYALAGAVAEVGSGPIVGGAVAAIEATLGTMISNRLGTTTPTNPAQRRAMPILFVIQPLFGALMGWLGALFRHG